MKKLRFARLVRPLTCCLLEHLILIPLQIEENVPIVASKKHAEHYKLYKTIDALKESFPEYENISEIATKSILLMEAICLKDIEGIDNIFKNSQENILVQKDRYGRSPIIAIMRRQIFDLKTDKIFELICKYIDKCKNNLKFKKYPLFDFEDVLMGGCFDGKLWLPIVESIFADTRKFRYRLIDIGMRRRGLDIDAALDNNFLKIEFHRFLVDYYVRSVMTLFSKRPWSFFLKCILKGKIEYVEYMLLLGISTKFTSNEKTPPEIASSNGHTEMEKLLLLYTNIENSKNPDNCVFRKREDGKIYKRILTV